MEENKRKNLPTNFEARKRKAEWILSDDKQRKEAEEKVRIFSLHFMIPMSMERGGGDYNC